MNFVYLDIDDPQTDTLKKALGYRYQPHLFIVDEDGKILYQWVGLVSEAELKKAIENSLK